MFNSRFYLKFVARSLFPNTTVRLPALSLYRPKFLEKD